MKLQMGKYKRLYNKARTMYYILAIKAFNKPRYPFYVNLVINSQCNLNCAYCFGRYSSRKQSYWQFDKLKKLIDDLYQRGTRYVIIQGGEPFLHPNLGEIIKYLDKKNIVAALVSNGTLTEKIKNTPEISLLDNICFSLDGSQKGNDKIRGEKTFSKVMKSIETVKKTFDTPIRINSTIHKYVVNDCGFMAEFVKKNKLEWGVSFLFKGDEKINQENLAPSYEEIKNYLKQLIKYKKRGYPIFTALNTLEYVLNWPFGFENIYVDKKKAKKVLGKKSIECQYGNYEIIIDENSKVYPCNGMQGIFNAQRIDEVGFDAAFDHLTTKPCYTCYIIPSINTSGMINWDMDIITDSIRHYIKSIWKNNE